MAVEGMEGKEKGRRKRKRERNVMISSAPTSRKGENRRISSPEGLGYR